MKCFKNCEGIQEMYGAHNQTNTYVNGIFFRRFLPRILMPTRGGGGGVSGLGKWKLGGKIMWKVEIRG